MPVVASLTQRRQIQEAGGFWSVVEYVGGRQYYFAPCNRVRVIVFRATPFALVFGPIKSDKSAAKLPVLWISMLVLGPNGHDALIYRYEEKLPK